MKLLRPLLLPVVCFAAAWLITTGWTRRTATPPPAEAPVAIRTSSSHPRRARVEPRKAVVENLVRTFKEQPMSEWAVLWEKFATTATVADLQYIPVLAQPPLTDSGRKGPNILGMLAAEELAVRTGRPAAITAESFAALAETDPTAAWQSLKQHNRVEFSCAALRTLARRDPLAALRQLATLPEGFREPVWEENSELDESPLGSIFGAWARRDPAAAAAAVMDLPQPSRIDAANHIAMTWAYRDGPAAIRYVLDFDQTGQGHAVRRFRMDVILRASFHTHPAETAKLMAAHPALRRAMAIPPCPALVMRPWYDADPEGAVAWLLGSQNDDETTSAEEKCTGALFAKLICEPEAAANLIRRFEAAGSTAGRPWVVRIHRSDPDLALSLAGELDIPLLDTPEVHEDRYWMEPEAECERWLEALRQSNDPDEALTSLGWTREMAFRLASRAAIVFPEKAAEIARLVPAAALEYPHMWQKFTPEMKRFWPELDTIATRQAAPYKAFEKQSLPIAEFDRDPASVAATLLSTPLAAGEVTTIVERWAPHDLPAARTWLSRVPAGPARDEGELALAKIQAPRDPLAALAFLTTNPQPGDPAAGQLWRTSLDRLVATGGDWEGWLARMPAEQQPRPGQPLAESIAAEAKLMKVLNRGRN